MPRRHSRKLEVRGLSGMLANFSKLDGTIQREFRILVKITGEQVRQLAYELAPKDTEFMADHILLRFSKDGLTFAVYLDPKDFAAAGLNFYPPYVEHGTQNSEAQPFMEPAFQAIAPFFKEDCVKLAKQAMRRAARRGTKQ